MNESWSRVTTLLRVILENGFRAIMIAVVLEAVLAAFAFGVAMSASLSESVFTNLVWGLGTLILGQGPVISVLQALFMAPDGLSRKLPLPTDTQEIESLKTELNKSTESEKCLLL